MWLDNAFMRSLLDWQVKLIDHNMILQLNVAYITCIFLALMQGKGTIGRRYNGHGQIWLFVA